MLCVVCRLQSQDRCHEVLSHPLWARIVVQRRRSRLVPCRLRQAPSACSAARLRYGSPPQSRSCGLHAASGVGGRRCRECRGRMRERGMCEAHVDAVAAAHDARGVPGRCLCGIRQRPPLLGDGNRRRWWQSRRTRLFHRRHQRTVSRRHCRSAVHLPLADFRTRQCPLVALSGHPKDSIQCPISSWLAAALSAVCETGVTTSRYWLLADVLEESSVKSSCGCATPRNA